MQAFCRLHGRCYPFAQGKAWRKSVCYWSGCGQGVGTSRKRNLLQTIAFFSQNSIQDRFYSPDMPFPARPSFALQDSAGLLILQDGGGSILKPHNGPFFFASHGFASKGDLWSPSMGHYYEIPTCPSECPDTPLRAIHSRCCRYCVALSKLKQKCGE